MDETTFDLSGLGEIREFQFLTDSSGIVLDGQGGLHSFVGDKHAPMAAPDGFRISKIHFLDGLRGAVLGDKTVLKTSGKKGAMPGDFFVIVPLLLLLLFPKRFFKFPATARLFASSVLAAGILFACSPKVVQPKKGDTQTNFITKLTGDLFYPEQGIHYYAGNRGMVSSYFAITENGGKTWATYPMLTDFYPSALAGVGGNYFAGAFAQELDNGISQYHGDGELYIYGRDSTFSKRLAANKPERPAGFSIGRGIKGISFSPTDSLVYVFGSEKERAFIITKLKWDKGSEGNIWVIPANLNPTHQIIDAPGKSMVLSLSSPAPGEIWVTMDNRTAAVVNRKVVLQESGNKKLLRFKNGAWDEINVPGCMGAKQVEFIFPGKTAYLIEDKTGQLFRSNDGGGVWASTGRKGVLQMRQFGGKISFMSEGGRLGLL